MNPANKKQLIIPTILILGIVAVLVWLLSIDPEGNNTPSTETQIGNNNTSQNQQSGNTSSTRIKYEGTDELISRGLTTQQANALRNGLDTFLKSKGQTSGTVRLTDVEHIVDRDSVSDVQNMYFTLQTSSGTYKARMDYFELDKMRLYLFDQSGTQVFDSGVITGKQ